MLDHASKIVYYAHIKPNKMQDTVGVWVWVRDGPQICSYFLQTCCITHGEHFVCIHKAVHTCTECRALVTRRSVNWNTAFSSHCTLSLQIDSPNSSMLTPYYYVCSSIIHQGLTCLVNDCFEGAMSTSALKAVNPLFQMAETVLQVG